MTYSQAKSWLKLVALAVLFWTALGVVFALSNIASGRSWRVTMLPSIASWWTWGLLTPLIIAVDRRLPFNSHQMGWRVAIHLLLSPIFTTLYLYLGPVVMTAMGGLGWQRLIRFMNLQLLMNSLRGMFLWSVLVYCLIVGVWQAHLYFQHYLSSECAWNGWSATSRKRGSMLYACNSIRTFSSTHSTPSLRRWNVILAWLAR